MMHLNTNFFSHHHSCDQVIFQLWTLWRKQPSNLYQRKLLLLCCTGNITMLPSDILPFQRLLGETVFIKWSYDTRSHESNFSYCVEKPEKFRTSTGFEPMISQCRCNALINWAMKPLILGAGHLGFKYSPGEWINEWNDIFIVRCYSIRNVKITRGVNEIHSWPLVWVE